MWNWVHPVGNQKFNFPIQKRNIHNEFYTKKGMIIIKIEKEKKTSLNFPICATKACKPSPKNVGSNGCALLSTLAS